MSDPLNPQFWQDDEDELWRAIAAAIIAAYLLGVDGGTNLLPSGVGQLVDYDLINRAAMEFAKEYRYDLIRGITETTRKQAQGAMADWINSGSPLDALETSLSPIFGESRANRIATTEATRVFARGNMDAWETTGLVSATVWMTAQDDLVCPICGELDGTHIGIGDIDAAPPAHANCRCYLQPELDMNLLEKRTNEILE